jgi:hypothetical protein
VIVVRPTARLHVSEPPSRMLASVDELNNIHEQIMIVANVSRLHIDHDTLMTARFIDNV